MRRWENSAGRWDVCYRLSASLTRGCVSLLLLCTTPGCDRASTEANGSKPSPAPVPPGIVRLDADAVAKAGIVIQPVTRGEFRTHRDFTGTVQANENELAEIAALVRGRIVDVYADLGQEVHAGSLLALLNSKELAMAQSSYLKARAMLHVAEQSFKRAQLLLDEKVIGRGEFQRRQGEMISTRAEARESRELLQLLGMDDKEISQIEQDQIIRSFASIRAPFAGRIIARNVTKGEVVGPEHKLFVVANLSQIWVLANIPEKDIPHIQAQQAVDIVLSAYPGERFPGTITYVGDVLDPATRTMRLRVVAPNHEGRLKPEMFATVRIYSAPDPNALTVPSSAIQRDRGKPVVFVQLGEQQFSRRDVTIESESGERVKVLDGLREGEQVVVGGAFVLKSEFANQQHGNSAP